MSGWWRILRKFWSGWESEEIAMKESKTVNKGLRISVAEKEFKFTAGEQESFAELARGG